MSTYDDPIVTAKRILTLNKDEPWAQKELAELMPLVLDAYDNLDDRYDERRERALEEEIDALECEVDDLTKELEELRARLNEGS